MRGFFFILIVACAAGGAFLAGRARPGTEAPWIVEVLRTTDARGMTYESLHSAKGEPDAQGTVMRWTDEGGRRWLFVDGALAHEIKEDKPKVDAP